MVQLGNYECVEHGVVTTVGKNDGGAVIPPRVCPQCGADLKVTTEEAREARSRPSQG